ncbi:hypothetical protein AX16_010151 [Volvariella volvacea WC 439]|nr:hypothetical protein AX16_010151 [Volvariella volvacea WC 439]
MLSLALQALVICALCWAGWRTFRGYVVKTELDNIPGPPSHSFWFGNYNKVFSTQGWDFHRTITKKYGSVIRMNMFLGEKQLYIYDPKALHNIIVKDQNIYEETEGFLTGNDLFFGPGLLATLGDQHRKQRKMLNPVFSMAHMRQMIPTFYEVIAKLEQALTQKIQQGEKEIEVVHWMTRTALELIGQSGLGYSFDTLVDGAAPHIYAVSVKELVPTSFKLFPLRSYVLPWAVKLGTPELRRSIVNLLPWDTLHKLRDMIDIMHETSVEIIEGKKKALREGDEAVARQIGHGKDIISILCKCSFFRCECAEADDGDCRATGGCKQCAPIWRHRRRTGYQIQRSWDRCLP